MLAEKGGVQLAFCWAHVRRRFYELAAAGPAPVAAQVLERIAALYKIEAEIRGRPAEVRRLARQERSLPILDTLEPFLRGKLQLISQKTKLAEAIRYTLFAASPATDASRSTITPSSVPYAHWR